MTNVDFFRQFAASTIENVKVAYYFEHGRQSRVDANLFDGTETQVKMFHYTRDIIDRSNEMNTVLGVEYRGTIYCIVKSDLDDLVDKDEQVGQSVIKNGKYDKHVKPLIDEGGILSEIRRFNRCDFDYDLTFSRIIEVYNFLDYNGDGIAFDYTLYIPNER